MLIFLPIKGLLVSRILTIHLLNKNLLNKRLLNKKLQDNGQLIDTNKIIEFSSLIWAV